MLPSHSVAAQNSPSPYVFSSSVNCFTPGQRLALTLTDPILSTQFDGLFVQARQNVGPVQSYGNFDTNNDNHLKTISCFRGSNFRPLRRRGHTSCNIRVDSIRTTGFGHCFQTKHWQSCIQLN